MGDAEPAMGAANDDFSGDPVGEPRSECRPKIYLIMVTDRAVDWTAGAFYHYSLEYWVSEDDVELYKNWDRPDFVKAHKGSAQIAAVELLREGGWKAYRYKDSWIPFTSKSWVQESVGVSVIHYSSRSANVLPLYKGTMEDVKAKWDLAISAAKVYLYAEQAGFGGHFKNWPNSIYLIGDGVNNSNTFVRYLVDVMGLKMVEMTGAHPGRLKPSPVTDQYSTPWPNSQAKAPDPPPNPDK